MHHNTYSSLRKHEKLTLECNLPNPAVLSKVHNYVSASARRVYIDMVCSHSDKKKDMVCSQTRSTLP